MSMCPFSLSSLPKEGYRIIRVLPRSRGYFRQIILVGQVLSFFPELGCVLIKKIAPIS